MNELRLLADFVSSLKLEDVPETVRKKAVLCILDSVAVAVGAKGDRQLENVTKLYLDISGEKEAACIWPTNQKTPVITAAFINAMAGHTLELDDVHTNSKTHIGTVVVPAAWALAESMNLSGSELLLAVICGYEVMARIGMGFGVSSHRERGWHATSTAGTFGAAAACAKLLGLDGEQTLSALGLAGTQSFGTWAFLGDGSSNKVLHPARAAASGLESALLAKAGMTGAEHILNAKDGGLYAAMSNEHDMSVVAGNLGTRYELEYMDNKPYAACRSTHCAIDGALALRKEYNLKADEIESVEVRTYLVGLKQCGVSEGSLNPKKPIDAKFSTPYNVACAFLFGESTLSQFEPEMVTNPEIHALLKKVQVVEDERFTKAYPGNWGCEVRATRKDGSVFSKMIQDASGSVDNPLTDEQIHAKALGLMKPVCPDAAEIILKDILALEKNPALPQIR